MEEHVGELWHKFISRLADKRYPRAAVALPEVQHGLGIFYRALGGDGGLQLQAADASENTAKRSWLQKLAGSSILPGRTIARCACRPRWRGLTIQNSTASCISG